MKTFDNFDKEENKRVFEYIKQKYMYSKKFMQQLGPMVNFVQQFDQDKISQEDFEVEVKKYQRTLTFDPDVFIYYFAKISQSLIMDEKTTDKKKEKYSIIYDFLHDLIDYDNVEKDLKDDLPTDVMDEPIKTSGGFVMQTYHQAPPTRKEKEDEELKQKIKQEKQQPIFDYLDTFKFTEPYTFKEYIKKSIHDWVRDQVKYDNDVEFREYDWLPYFFNLAQKEGRIDKVPQIKLIEDEDEPDVFEMEDVDFENCGVYGVNNKSIRFYAGGDWQPCSDVTMKWNNATQKFEVTSKETPENGEAENEMDSKNLFNWAFDKSFNEVYTEL